MNETNLFENSLSEPLEPSNYVENNQLDYESQNKKILTFEEMVVATASVIPEPYISSYLIDGGKKAISSEIQNSTQMPTLMGANVNGIRISAINVTSSSFQVVVTYPTSGAFHNLLNFWDSVNGWRGVSNTEYTKNGTYNVANLRPSTTYYCDMNWYVNNIWYTERVIVKTDPIPEVLTRTDGTYLFYNLEANDTNSFASGKYKIFRDRLDLAYTDLYELVGKKPYNGAKIEVKSTRENINAWAVSGQPIKWAQGWVYDQILKVNNNDDWSFGLMHELGHDFDDGAKYNFSSEFWANFKMYYIVEKRNAIVCAGPGWKVYQGTQLKNYYKSGNDFNYDNTIAKGNYHHDGLTYTFMVIKDRIGWTPFTKTFQYFETLKNPPQSELGKLNHFLTKLKEFSGVDVLSLIPANDRTVYSNYFGGTLEYYSLTMSPSNILQGSGSNLLDKDNPVGVQSKLSMSYTLGGGKWIYNNYPEELPPTGAFADVGIGSKYLNMQGVVKNVGNQIFYSHVNHTGESVYYGIRIYNPNNTVIKFNPSNYGHVTTTSLSDRYISNWKDFYNGISTMPKDASLGNNFTINPNQSYWIEQQIPAEYDFSGNLRFTIEDPSGSLSSTTDAAIIYIYIYKNKANINLSGASAFAYTGTRGYSGFGKGYFYTADSCKMNFSLASQKYYFTTSVRSSEACSTPITVYGNANGITGSDLIDLTFVNGSEEGDKNLGNWCVQYHIPFEIKNTTGKPIIVNGYFRRFKDDGNGQIILRAENYSNTLDGMLYAGTQRPKNNSWKWFEAKIAPNDTFTGSYQYILGTNSYSRIFHMWEARFA